MNTRTIPALSIAAISCFLSTPALAASITSYNGTYAMECESATLTGNIAVAAPGGTANLPVTLQLYCDPDDEELLEQLAELEAATKDACDRLTNHWSGCANEAAKVSDALYQANHDVIGMLPATWSPKVTNPNDFWAKLFNMYNFWGPVVRENGQSATLGVVLNDAGRFWTGGLAVPWASAGEYGGCVIMGMGQVGGTIDAGKQYALAAQYGVNASLTCLAGQGNAWLAFNIGVTLQGSMSGTKTQ